MKLLYILLFIILSGCSNDFKSTSTNPSICKEQGYLGIVIYGSNMIACSDGERTQDGLNYKTSNGSIRIGYNTINTKNGSYDYHNYFLKF